MASHCCERCRLWRYCLIRDVSMVYPRCISRLCGGNLKFKRPRQVDKLRHQAALPSPHGAIISASPCFPTLMDEQVIAAMARWPDVPAVYGWLSLSEAGLWRLHPKGDALQHPEAPGEEITSPQILAFMNLNYTSDALGQWYFQNGPQRVYVRLDAAPFVVHTTTDTRSGRLNLRTHTGLDIGEVRALHLDENGRLFADTDRGAALIKGRDLPALLDSLQPAASATASLPA